MGKLVIRDGSGDEWWESQDLWVTPNTPDDHPSSPGVGIPNFVWARVRNESSKESVKGAVVRFYWSDPTTGVLRSASTLIGTAYVDLAAGEMKEVLCLTPWVPIIVNGGHECIVGEVIHPVDPLPSPLPDAFDPPTYRQIAQRNLNVVHYATGISAAVFVVIAISASSRNARQSMLDVEVTNGSLSPALLRQLGVREKPAANPWVQAGLTPTPRCNEVGDPRLAVSVEGGRQVGVSLNIKSAIDQPEGYQVVRVRERSGNRIMGGTTFVVVPSRGGNR